MTHKKMDSRLKGLCLMVRMNFIMDYAHLFTDDAGSFPKTQFRRLLERCPVYVDGAYTMITPCKAVNCTFAVSSRYDWKRALVCTTVNFVHLLSSQIDLGPRSLSRH